MTERVLNSGTMPNTDFHYEEFEGLLGSYYLTLQPLNGGGEQDQTDLETITAILDGFAERHHIQKPEEAAGNPRSTPAEWGQPRVIESCFSVLDLMGSFWRDFGVGAEPDTIDSQERLKLGQRVLGVLHRHNVIQAEFEEINGVSTPVKIISRDENKLRLTLDAIL